MPTTLYCADVVCPMTGPPLVDGGVLVRDSQIVAVGERRALADEAERVDVFEGVLLPGLVNARTHVEHADAHPLARSGPHHVWEEAVDGLTARWDERRWRRSAQRGVHLLLRAGVTAVGDVVHHGPGVPALGRAGLVGTSWIDVAHVAADELQAVVAAVERGLTTPAAGRVIGVGPRAPHLLDTDVLRALCQVAERAAAPLHLVAARSQAEVVALWSGSGPVVDRLKGMGLRFAWMEAGGTELSPVRYLAQAGALGPRTTLANTVWVDDAEARLLGELGVAVVCCPRSDQLLQVGEVPLERYAEAGIALAVGSDGAAATPDQDILAEAAAWVRLASARGVAFWPTPAGPLPLPEAAVRLITADGAGAMGWGDRAGVLAPGRRADFVVVDVRTDAGRVFADLIEQGPGRQVLTVLGGVRRARRDSADQPWPEIDHELAGTTDMGEA